MFYVLGSVMDILSKEPKDSLHMGLAPATVLKSGSVMDVLNKGKKSKDSLCLGHQYICLTTNLFSSTSRFVDTSSGSQSSSVGSLFKKPTGSWECSTCLIQNKPEVEKCAACETPRPKPKTSAPTTVSTSKVHSSSCSAPKPCSHMTSAFALVPNVKNRFYGNKWCGVHTWRLHFDSLFKA